MARTPVPEVHPPGPRGWVCSRLSRIPRDPLPSHDLSEPPRDDLFFPEPPAAIEGVSVDLHYLPEMATG